MVLCGVMSRKWACVVSCCDLCALKVKITLCYGSVMRTFIVVILLLVSDIRGPHTCVGVGGWGVCGEV